MEYGQIIYESLVSLMDIINDDKKEVMDKFLQDMAGISEVPTWEQFDQLGKDFYNEIALQIIREYIKSSPL